MNNSTLRDKLLSDNDPLSSHDDQQMNYHGDMDEGDFATVMFYNNNDDSSSAADSDSGDEEAYQLLSIPHTLLKKDRLIDINPEDKSLEEEEEEDDDDDYDRDDREAKMGEIRMNKMSDIVKNSGDFKALPDEVVLRIFKYLDSDSLGRISRTCKRFHDISYDNDVWEHVSKKELWGKTFKGYSRSDYVSRKKGFEDHVNEKKQNFIRELRASKQSLRESRAKDLFCALGMNRANEIACIILLFILTSFICTKLDHKFDAPWPCVLIPLYLLTAFIFGPIIIYILLTWYSQLHLEDEFDLNLLCGQTFLWILSFSWLDIRKLVSFLKLFTWVFMWVAGLILLSLKLTGVGIHWAIVSIPFHFILLTMGVIIVRRKNLLDDDECFERCYMVPILLLISIFLILLVVQLETNVYWSWHIVFIPLYIIDFLSVFYLLAPLISMCCFWSFDDLLDDDPQILMALVGLFDFFIMGPILIFKILLGLTLDGIKDYTFSSIFSTLYIVESLGFLMYLFFWLAL